MTLYDLKPAFTNLLRPACRWLANRGVTPNQLTISAALLSVMTGASVALLHQHAAVLLAVPVVILVRMGLNALDGMLAREHDQRTPLGGFLNELGDVVSDIALYLPFAMITGVSGELVLLIVLLAVLLGLAADRHWHTAPWGALIGTMDRGSILLSMPITSIPGTL